MCWQDSTKPNQIHTSCLTRSLSARIAQSLAANYRAYSAGGGVGGCQASWKLHVSQHKHTHRLDINNTWVNPLKSSSSRALLEQINLVPAERWCAINSKPSSTGWSCTIKRIKMESKFHPGVPLQKHPTLNLAKARAARCQMKQIW